MGKLIFLNGGYVKLYKRCTNDSCLYQKMLKKNQQQVGLLVLLDLSGKRKLFLTENHKDPLLHFQGLS